MKPQPGAVIRPDKSGATDQERRWPEAVVGEWQLLENLRDIATWSRCGLRAIIAIWNNAA